MFMTLTLFNPFEDLIFGEQFCFLTGELTTEKMTVFPEWLMQHFKFDTDRIEMMDKSNDLPTAQQAQQQQQYYCRKATTKEEQLRFSGN